MISGFTSKVKPKCDIKPNLKSLNKMNSSPQLPINLIEFILKLVVKVS